MKAQFVNENISFERGRDPKGSLGIGVPRIQEIKRNFEDVAPYIESMRADELDFRDFRYKVESLKDVVEVIIINHMKSKYGIDLELIPYEQEGFTPSHRRFAAGKSAGGYHFVFFKNGPGNAFWFKVQIPDGDLVEETQSSMLSTLDKKVGKFMRKYKIS
jgi:hypothetical protein